MQNRDLTWSGRKRKLLEGVMRTELSKKSKNVTRDNGVGRG